MNGLGSNGRYHKPDLTPKDYALYLLCWSPVVVIGAGVLWLLSGG